MAWVTMIGPSDEQVEYRLTGGHGCGKSVTVDAAPLIAAIETAAEDAGTTVAALLGSTEAKKTYFRTRSRLRNGQPARLTGFDAVELAAAAGLSARELYGDQALPRSGGDGQVDYHLDASERPLVWIGGGLTEFGITPGSILDPGQFPAARRIMRGEDPHTGKTLVEPKVAIAPAAKLPAAPLARAIRRTAAERSVNPASLLDSKRKKDAFRRMENQLARFGESHRIPASTLLQLAGAVGIDAVALYGEAALQKAVAAEAGGRLDARPLLRAVQARATETGQQPADLFAARSMQRRYTQTEGEARRRLRDLPMDVREALAMARAAGLDPERVWDSEEIKAALLEGRVQVGNRGADVTLDLAKSQSVLLAYAPEKIAAKVEGIYTAAGRESISALERWTAYGMRGRNGDGAEPETVKTSGFSGWMMVHRAARPVDGAPYGDPHFHLHFTLANMARGTDGQWSTVAAGGRDLNRHARATQALMNARIRRELTDEFGISFRRQERTGAWEIAAIPEATVRLFSKRDSQVRELLTKLGIDYDSATTRERTAASTASKAAKNGETAVEDDVLRAYWQAEGRAAGDDPDAIAASAMDQARTVGAPDLGRLCAEVFDPKSGLTSRAKEFTHAAAIAAVLDALPYGVADADEAERLTNSVLRHAGYAVKLKPKGAQHFTHADRYTTADVIAAEALIVTEATNRLNEHAAVVSSDTVAMTLSAVEAQHGGTWKFSDEQRAVLERLLTAGHGIDAVEGIAGSGKTTIMNTARAAWEANGLVIAGASTAAVAAANLKAEAGITSRTLASWLTGIRTGGPGLTGVDVLVVDEAAMCDDRDIAELLTHAAMTGTKIIGIGDPKQLHSPGIGGSFAAVHHIVGGLSLSENFRQRNQIERRALELWRDDNRTAALRTFAGTGRVHALADKDEALAAMLTVWADKRAAHTDDHTAVQQLLMLASTNEVVEELNIGARAIREASGALTGPEHLFALAGGGELALSVGDQVLLRTNDYRSKRTRGASEDVLNGLRGIVRAVDEDRRVLVEWRTKTEGGGHRDVAEWVDADYIAQGGLSLGYAITGHKSQGLSVEEALVYGPGAQANALYTMMSRDKAESHLFLPLSLYETDADRAREGEALTDQEQLDRAVAGLIREVETGTEERMILTELPPAAVPAHVRHIVPDLPTPRAPGTGDSREPDDIEDSAPEAGQRRAPDSSQRPDMAPSAEPATARTTAARPYAHLSSTALRDAVRKAAAAARATATAAQKAEAAADRAEQQTTAGAGPNVLALSQRQQQVAARAGAIREVRALDGTVAEQAALLRGTQERIAGLDQQLAATGRLGRPVLRGAQRTAAETEREHLIRERQETEGELETARTRLLDVAEQAGPAGEHDAVLTEFDMPQQQKDALRRRAQGKDDQTAKHLRAEAAAARSTARAATARESGLRAELAFRTGQGRPAADTAAAAPAAPRTSSPYANPADVDYQPAGPPPDGAHDAMPV